MKLLTVLICWRGFAVLVPVVRSPTVREKSIVGKSFLNASSGSTEVGANGMPAGSPGVSLRRSSVWSMNCPQSQPICETPFSSKMFLPMSLKTRLLTYRADRPPSIALIPSA